jgi:hypothetical protein
MSYPTPTTIDEPQKLVILPDWATAIQQRTTYRTDISRSRTGLEQRAQRRRRPFLSIEYRATVQSDPAQRRIEATLLTSRTPLIVPWWPNGGILSDKMPNQTIVNLTSRPIAEDWTAELQWVFLWGRAEQQGEWREFASISGSTVTLIDTGFHLRFEAGGFIFPGKLCTREIDNQMLNRHHHRESTDTIKFRTL